MDIKEKYEQALEKWEQVLELFRERAIGSARSTYGEFCSFCKDAKEKKIKRKNLDIGTTFGYFCYIEECELECDINPSICGTERSLLALLDDAANFLDDEKTEKQIIQQIIDALKHELTILEEVK